MSNTLPKWKEQEVNVMDKLSGTVVPVSKDKGIASIEVKVTIVTDGEFKVSDIQLQEGGSQTQYNRSAYEQFTDETNEMHFNFLARGTTTLIVPYMSEVPYDTSGVTLPCETDYITTPIKTDLLIHKTFVKGTEVLGVGSGLTGTAKRFELNTNVASYTHCVYNGYNSKQYIGGVENNNVFIGRELRLANADAKFTINQNEKRKSTGVLYANKTRREV